MSEFDSVLDKWASNATSTTGHRGPVAEALDIVGEQKERLAKLKKMTEPSGGALVLGLGALGLGAGGLYAATRKRKVEGEGAQKSAALEPRIVAKKPAKDAPASHSGFSPLTLGLATAAAAGLTGLSMHARYSDAVERARAEEKARRLAETRAQNRLVRQVGELQGGG